MLTIKSPMHNKSKPVSKKHLMASLGLQTMGSPLMLKDVLRITGTPVYCRKLSSNSQNRSFICFEINCGLQVPSTCVTAGMTFLFSSLTLHAVIIYLSFEEGERYSFAYSSMIEGQKGLKGSRNFTRMLIISLFSGFLGSNKMDLPPKALGPDSIFP